MPSILAATGFRGGPPKALANDIGAHAVGGVCGIYGVSKPKQRRLLAALRDVDVSKQIVAHSNGFRKVEINQFNTLLNSLLGGDAS